MRRILIPEHERRSRAGLVHVVHEHFREIPDPSPAAVRVVRCGATGDLFEREHDARLLREAADALRHDERLHRGLLQLADRMEAP